MMYTYIIVDKTAIFPTNFSQGWDGFCDERGKLRHKKLSLLNMITGIWVFQVSQYNGSVKNYVNIYLSDFSLKLVKNLIHQSNRLDSQLSSSLPA